MVTRPRSAEGVFSQWRSEAVLREHNVPGANAYQTPLRISANLNAAFGEVNGFRGHLTDRSGLQRERTWLRRAVIDCSRPVADICGRPLSDRLGDHALQQSRTLPLGQPDHRPEAQHTAA